MKRGLLLINLGTPDAPAVPAVRRYLREFLSDPRVIDLPSLVRYILLYCFILPFRPQQSTHAYQRIWTEQGSPLLTNSMALAATVAKRLQATHSVVLGMRYGQPSLTHALAQLADCDEITILPLFPHYASATTGSCIEWIMRYFSTKPIFPHLHIIRDFYQHPAFIQAVSEQIKPYIPNHDYILFSYHGVPVRHLNKIGCNPICTETCPTPTSGRAACYRAQCVHTTQLIADELQLKPRQFGYSFQSRLGKTAWITPYTDHLLPLLAKSGIKKLAIVCPSFSVDCLETLEEIGMQAKEQWLSLGGEAFSLIPCVNDSPLFVEAIVSLLH
jgi:ferrochelatase